MYLTADGVELHDGDRVFPAFGYDAIVGTDELAAGAEYYSTPLAAKVGRLRRLQGELAEVRKQQDCLLDEILHLQASILASGRVAAAIQYRPKPAALATES